MRFTPASNIRRGQEGKSEQHEANQFEQSGLMPKVGVGVEPETNSADRHTQNHQRVQANQPDLEKFLYSHFAPSVVVCITHYESGEQVKKINSQVAMVHGMVGHHGEISFA